VIPKRKVLAQKVPHEARLDIIFLHKVKFSIIFELKSNMEYSQHGREVEEFFL
jgi:hypothetical protein